MQYGAIRKFALVVAVVIFMSYQFRPYTPTSHGVSSVNPFLMGTVGCVSFLLVRPCGCGCLVALCQHRDVVRVLWGAWLQGCTCSAFAGYVSMWVSARANIRVASAARRSYVEALLLCFRGGAFSAVLVISMCVLGVTTLHFVLHAMFVGDPNVAGSIAPSEVPLLLAGYGFGASFVALFMQLGGGVYTKAADVGADLVGKVERSIPEDDPRNPAVIADLVGDMVGDCVGSSAGASCTLVCVVMCSQLMSLVWVLPRHLRECRCGDYWRHDFGWCACPRSTLVVVQLLVCQVSLRTDVVPCGMAGWP